MIERLQSTCKIAAGQSSILVEVLGRNGGFQARPALGVSQLGN
ncbi:hypothetical protein HMPREF0495_01045 [Levilactobacillus brevis ATCC 14869 = DSM 20054]|uniref:Uncharacterized protein n=1 Tax=Levilactobacillus brevis ATCC 14869 = DSM 20054 TaxID=649758 RepID=U2PKI5_LEVBR|nr:hypothetical protein HMPREF0495_01045 [Levilactobacillus brevis ATCC 14869 = DSM 20054]